MVLLAISSLARADWGDFNSDQLTSALDSLSKTSRPVVRTHVRLALELGCGALLCGSIGAALCARKELFGGNGSRETLPEAPAVPIPQRRPSADFLWVAKDGKELGNARLMVVKSHLRTGKLALTDQYFDSHEQQWFTLDRHPELNASPREKVVMNLQEPGARFGRA